MKQAVAIIIGCVMIGTTTVSFAGDDVRDEMTVFGHKIAVLGPFNEEKLVVDGRPLVEDALIAIHRIDYVGGVGVLVGGASGGGSACDVSPFIVSFVKGGPAKVDGPLDQCGMGEIEIGPNEISVVDPAFPYKPGHRHSWIPSGGFKDAGEVVFKPEAKTGWDTLPRHGLLYPWDLYKNSEVNAAIKMLTGSTRLD